MTDRQTATGRQTATDRQTAGATGPRTLFIKTYGCQMNVYDSERMRDALAPLGFRPVAAPDGADMVILNTCHIREKASEKVFSELGRLRALKAEKEAAGGRMIVAVAGCTAQAEGEEIQRRMPMVDLVFGPQSYHRLPEMLARAERETGLKLVETEFPVEDKFDHLPEARRVDGVAAFLTVQEGCDKFCTFCVVPYTRGAEASRPVDSVLAEARRLAAQGVRELTLLGQNVNAYHGEGPDGREWGLGRLARAIAEIEGIARIRYTTSHPRDLDDDLIAAHRDAPELMPYLHLPVQSGSDRILQAMNRKHTADDYRRLVEKLRAARPDIALTSDFIVGFPGETDADFAQTLKLVDEIGYAGAFSFKYSPRPGTPAALAEAQVPDAVMDARLAGLQQLIDAQQEAFNHATVGATLPVLIEKPGRKPGQMVGRSPYLQPVHIDGGPDLVGRVIPCRIDALRRYSLFATPVEALSPAAEAAGEKRPEAAEAAGAKRPEAAEAAGEKKERRLTSTRTSSGITGAAGAPLFLQFDDNRLLPELFGEHDKHLVRIEESTGVSLINRGNRLAIEGPEGSADIAKEALSRLYQRLKGGQSIDPADVDAAVRMATQPANLFGEQEPIIRTRRKQISARTPTQCRYIEAIRNNDLVFGLGPAGTGKTYLAVCIGVAMYLNNQVERIVLTRPAVEAGERLGFLPGDVKEKIDPYLRPIYDALYDTLPADQVARKIDSGEIEIAPLAFMRGRTLKNAFVLLDEGQNTSIMQMKMFLTRLGENSRMIITGDLSQVDLPPGQKSGLRDAVETLQGVRGVDFVRFDDKDVVRHPLVARIVKAYDERRPPRDPLDESEEGT